MMTAQATGREKAYVARQIKRLEADLHEAKQKVANGSWMGIHAARVYLDLRWMRQVRARLDSIPASEAWALDLPKKV